MKIKLTDIFTKSNTDRLWLEQAEFFKHFDEDHLQFIKDSIEKAKFCCDLEYAKATFSCPICGTKDYRPVSCKCKFCSSCGKLYAEKWALKLSEDLIDRKHRHIIFTMPDILWNYTIAKRHALSIFTDHINQLFKNWFNKNKVKHYGLIIAIHTFGRDSSFNVHFHIIVSLGGFKKDMTWKKLEYFDPNFFNKSWRHLVLKTVKSIYPKCSKTKKTISECYKMNFFVNLEGEPLKADHKSLQYIGRYLMRPAIAEYRITEYDGETVTFWYIDTKTKEKKTTTLPVIDFMKRLVLHIHPKNFKAIRRYGFYARNIISSLKIKLKTLKRKLLFRNQALSWAERLKVQYGKIKLVCLNCNIPMELSKFLHKKYGVYHYK